MPSNLREKSYSLGGAAFSFIGLIFLVVYGDSLAFVYGGALNLSKIGDKKHLLLFIYVLAFMGFGVKAAMTMHSSRYCAHVSRRKSVPKL